MRKYVELADVNIVMGAVELEMEPASAELPKAVPVAARKEAPWAETANALELDLWQLRQRITNQQDVIDAQAEMVMSLQARIVGLEQRTWFSMLRADLQRLWQRVRIAIRRR